MNLFDDFLKKFSPTKELKKPSDEMLNRFRETLPKELLDFWKEYGFGNYSGGLLKVIDPTDYTDSLNNWLGGVNPARVPILMTGFGNILYYRKLSDTENDVCLLDIHYRQTTTCSYSFGEFFQYFITDDGIIDKLLRKELFEKAVGKFGEPEANEIFFFVPALAYGGSETLKYVQKGDAVVHQHLLFEMLVNTSEDNKNKEEGDVWSEAYEANPNVLERNDGSLMVNFTLTETVDTILPKTPEKMYTVEGKNISLWTLTLFSLTKNDTLDMIEYHVALCHLQPYIIDEQESHILLRGLTLEEMEVVLADCR